MQRALAGGIALTLAFAPALAFALLAMPSATAHPSDCDGYYMDSARVCRELPSGQRGYYVDCLVLFAFAGSGSRGTEAGAGSLAGGSVRVFSGDVTVLAYANSIVAYDTVVVRAEPDAWGAASGGPWGLMLTVPVDHVGISSEEAFTGTAFAGDADGDGNPDVVVTALGEEVQLLP